MVKLDIIIISEIVVFDAYFISVLRYIHQNTIEVAIIDTMGDIFGDEID